jgi:hypothetical protein
MDLTQETDRQRDALAFVVDEVYQQFKTQLVPYILYVA